MGLKEIIIELCIHCAKPVDIPIDKGPSIEQITEDPIEELLLEDTSFETIQEDSFSYQIQEHKKENIFTKYLKSFTETIEYYKEQVKSTYESVKEQVKEKTKDIIKELKIKMLDWYHMLPFKQNSTLRQGRVNLYIT